MNRLQILRLAVITSVVAVICFMWTCPSRPRPLEKSALEALPAATAQTPMLPTPTARRPILYGKPHVEPEQDDPLAVYKDYHSVRELPRWLPDLETFAPAPQEGLLGTRQSMMLPTKFRVHYPMNYPPADITNQPMPVLRRRLILTASGEPSSSMETPWIFPTWKKESPEVTTYRWVMAPRVSPKELKKYDQDQDGRLNDAEWDNLHRVRCWEGRPERTYPPPSTEEVETYLRHDLNHDGWINDSERQADLPGHLNRVEKRIEVNFDVDQDGKLNANERREARAFVLRNYAEASDSLNEEGAGVLAGKWITLGE